eukprot:CAMPEP_0198241868 /NCGR_PEP_ID=MMETSP1446-20131203/6912_1 /TAXON_ID=1461542 ORGANISM="Unidentified sp, Strain CCMP2111" /NCGR_SAMPLE_ID=MMETSP1446 /ASSEMBLY_ACC=CAM_ASM_001112 /LENGTH=412 /DNA_ID=CAMNT_0043924771 /DNA_START=33 /DNA_END=1271 /DNA_ORIENTATION=+
MAARAGAMQAGNRGCGAASGMARAAHARAAARAPGKAGMRGGWLRAHAQQTAEEMGFKTMRKGVKEAADESLLTPRFYTTDFDEMEELFNTEINKNLDQKEFEACLQEFRNDYNKVHFVRNDTFKKAADKITGDTRKIFIEFLERSCTAEFSGFLLYKELGRRLKTINPAVAEIFTLMSRDEARHAGFLNKALSDFGLALDLGFMTKNRTYTFFKPKFILYATYLSEKIGYWRYITIYRTLQRNPDNQLYPIFEYFENWCQDENRHGDFFSAMLKSQPQYLNDWQSRLWCRFFCLSVYITMYLNDHQRTAFYETVGLNTTQFNKHVIIETNKTTERIFSAVPDVEHPDFFPKMDQLVVLNAELLKLGKEGNNFGKFITMGRMAIIIIEIFLMKSKQTGSFSFLENAGTAVQY